MTKQEFRNAELERSAVPCLARKRDRTPKRGLEKGERSPGDRKA